MNATRILLVILSLFTVSTTACDRSDAAPGTKEGKNAEKSAPVKVEKVVVAKEGTKFDPPVEVSQMPAGVWYCDMGTVHYAQQEEGDGKCQECGMKLIVAVE